MLLIVSNNLLAHSYYIKYSNLIQTMCIQLYDFKYSYSIAIIFKQTHRVNLKVMAMKMYITLPRTRTTPLDAI